MTGNKKQKSIFSSAAKTDWRENACHGFTMVELLASVGLFMVVVTASMSLFLAVVQGNRKAAAIQNVVDEGRFVLEVISRDIRTGTGFSVPASNAIQFTNTDSIPVPVCYRYNGNPVYTIEKVVNPGAGCTGAGTPVTSSHIRVDHLQFVVSGTTLGDNVQPRITILMGISNKGNKAESVSSINLQTTVSPRLLDL